MISDALAIAIRPFLFLLDFVWTLLYESFSIPFYFALFAASVIIRFFIRPIIGEGVRDFNTEVKKTGRENYKKLRGGD